MNTLEEAFGLNAEELERRGGPWTAREITQQPGIWRAVEAQVGRERAGLEAFLAPLLQRSELRILLTGAGTSAFIGECLAPAMLRRWQRPVEAIATTDLVSGPGQYLLVKVPTLLVSFARSGNSPESAAAVEIAGRHLAECHHLILTCNEDGVLCRFGREQPNARVLLLPPETNDRSFAMTSSFSAMLLAAALIFRLLPEGGRGVDAMAKAALAVLATSRPVLERLVAERFERVVCLGAKELKGLAREVSLKLLELTDGRVVATSDTTLGFRHGPKTVVNGRTLVLVFLSNGRYSRQYDLDLLEELRRDAVAGRVLALTARAGSRPAHADDVLVPGLGEMPDLGLCLPYVVFAQSLALLQSLALGLRPDSPNAAGTVNRVVRGVSIYPAERLD